MTDKSSRTPQGQTLTTLGRFRNWIKIYLAGLAGALLIRFISRTLRWTYVGFDGETAHWPSGEPSIITFWHGRQLMMHRVYLNFRNKKDSRRIAVLISQHSDGRIIADIMRRLDVDSIAGSSSKGGGRALIQMIKAIRAGNHLGITPDGPRGPCHQAKEGVILLAQKTQALIRPVSYSAEKRWTFGSWDGMILPKPFSRAVMIMGESMRIPENANASAQDIFRKKIEEVLCGLNEEADSYWAHPRKP